GAIRGYWDSKGALASAIGFPTTTEVPEARSGVSQTFDNARVWWSAATGAHEVHGAIRAFYEAAAGPASFLGFPTSDELASPGGASQVFAGARVWWSATTSAQETHGGIRSVYEQRGGPGSRLGYPTTNELRSADATTAYQLFQGGRIDFPLNGAPPTVTYT
ncbi:MAG: LGFP repeat-containing protein, partial [Lapillicoccus sp.]